MSNKPINRRRFLHNAGMLGAGIPLVGLTGCNLVTDAQAAANLGENLLSPSGWASGGTASLTAAFPGDAIFDSGESCNLSLTGPQIEGPCYFEVSERDDISEGQPGLPMQMSFQVVDSNCRPVRDLEVEAWHCNNIGEYSGDTTGSEDSGRFQGNFCTGGGAQANQAKWFRGKKVTNSSGRVDFISCFPGWYATRTIHVHVRVRNRSSQEVVTQFCFPDEFTEMVCTNHTDYVARGVQDTPLSSGRGDFVFGRNYSDFYFNLSKNSDGSLLAYKTIMIS